MSLVVNAHKQLLVYDYYSQMYIEWYRSINPSTVAEFAGMYMNDYSVEVVQFDRFSATGNYMVRMIVSPVYQLGGKEWIVILDARGNVLKQTELA